MDSNPSSFSKMSTNRFVLSRDQVFYIPGLGLADLGGRTMDSYKQSNGFQTSGLFEWRASVPANLEDLIAEVVENIPTNEDVNRPEEVRTLKLEGVFKAEEPSVFALVYECFSTPFNLRDVLLTTEKPSGVDRIKFAAIIATQIRSLHVHFRLRHVGLRPESFVFFGSLINLKKPDLSNPYLLDWGRLSSPSIYEHPEYEEGQPLWFHDVWSLMMILADIAEWKPVDKDFKDTNGLLQKKLQRKEEVMDVNWQGDRTAEIMQYGFKFLEKDRSTLNNLSRKKIKHFFDRLCSLLNGA